MHIFVLLLSVELACVKEAGMVRVFFDMDGVLAEYKYVEYEELLKEGYFLNLKPQEEVVSAIIKLAQNPEFEVFTLSAVLPDNPYAAMEKKMWLDRYVNPSLNNIVPIFVEYGTDKSSAVPGGIRASDVLIDDYNVNLFAWAKDAKAIKLLNGLNHKRGTWKGLTAEKNTESIIKAVEEIA